MESLLSKDSEDLRSVVHWEYNFLVSAIPFSLIQYKFYIHSSNHFLKYIIKYER